MERQPFIAKVNFFHVDCLRLIKNLLLKFNRKHSNKSLETYQFMKKNYGNCCLSRSNFFIWHTHLLNGSDTLDDDQHNGNLFSSNKERARGWACRKTFSRIEEGQKIKLPLKQSNTNSQKLTKSLI